jgi:hypothetical protein
MTQKTSQANVKLRQPHSEAQEQSCAFCLAGRVGLSYLEGGIR